MDPEILHRSPLFRGLEGDALNGALRFFHAQAHSFRRGKSLNRVGEPVHRFGLLLAGSVQVFMDDLDGNHMLMASVTPGNTFAESLCFLGEEAKVRIECMTDSEVLMMDTASIVRPDGVPTAMERELTGRFISMLARRALDFNDRIQILCKPTIREKVTTLLSQYVAREGSPCVTLPFNREAMATYLGVNQSALSRELSRMQREGILRFSGSTFRIL